MLTEEEYRMTAALIAGAPGVDSDNLDIIDAHLEPEDD